MKCNINTNLRVVSIISVHEGEAFLVLLWPLGSEFFFETDFCFLFVIVVKRRFDPDTTGHHCSQTTSQRMDLQVVNCSVVLVYLLGVQVADQLDQIFVEVVLNYVALQLRRFLYVVVHHVQNLENGLKGVLIDVRNSDLNKTKSTFPFSTASASSTYFIAAACCSVSS